MTYFWLQPRPWPEPCCFRDPPPGLCFSRGGGKPRPGCWGCLLSPAPPPGCCISGVLAQSQRVTGSNTPARFHHAQPDVRVRGRRPRVPMARVGWLLESPLPVPSAVVTARPGDAWGAPGGAGLKLLLFPSQDRGVKVSWQLGRRGPSAFIPLGVVRAGGWSGVGLSLPARGGSSDPFYPGWGDGGSVKEGFLYPHPSC